MDGDLTVSATDLSSLGKGSTDEEKVRIRVVGE